MSDCPKPGADTHDVVYAHIPAMVATLYRHHRETAWKRADPCRHLFATPNPSWIAQLSTPTEEEGLGYRVGPLQTRFGESNSDYGFPALGGKADEIIWGCRGWARAKTGVHVAFSDESAKSANMTLPMSLKIVQFCEWLHLRNYIRPTMPNHAPC